MDDKILKDRIPESELSNEFKRDGETLYGEDLNRMVTVTKGGINYNAKLFESYLYGDEYRPFYHGNEVDWQIQEEYISYGIVYWVRSILDVLTGLPYVYVTKMEYNGTSESWVEKEIIKFIDTEHLNNVLKDYLKKSGGDMHGNLDMGGYNITSVDTLKTFTLKANEIDAGRALKGLTVEDYLNVEGDTNVTGSVKADKAITKEIALLSSAGQEEANIKIDENGNIDFNGKTVVNIELPEVEAKLDVKLDGKLDKLTGGGETGLRVYAAFNGGVETSLDVDVNPSSFTLARRGGNGEVWTGDATKKHDAVPLGQLNTFLETKVDKVEGKQLSDENFTSAEKSKLAGLESSRFVGQFVSLQALKAAYPTAPIGSYAYVDEGSGKNTVKYVWDSSDSTWVSGIPSTAELTPAMVKQLYEENDDTNAYTDAEKGKVALIDSKLDKKTYTSLSTLFYVKMPDGSQEMMELDKDDENSAGSVPFRNNSRTFRVGDAVYGDNPVTLGQADERYAVKSVEETKQDKLVSGVNIKTLGGQSLLGSGNIPIPSTDAFVSKSIGLKGGIDLDTVITSGFYRILEDSINGPSEGSHYSQMIVSRGEDTITQLLFPYASGTVWVRSGSLDSFKTNGWKKLALDNEVVKLTGNQTISGEKTFTNPLVASNYIVADWIVDKAGRRRLLELIGGILKIGGAFPIELVSPTPPTITSPTKSGEIAVMSDLDWTLIATNSSSTNDVINLPSGIKEILIIAGSGYTTVHLPNISEAAGVTIELFNGSNVHKGASWRINGNTVVKTWSGSGTTPNNVIYEIYGR